MSTVQVQIEKHVYANSVIKNYAKIQKNKPLKNLLRRFMLLQNSYFSIFRERKKQQFLVVFDKNSLYLQQKSKFNFVDQKIND